MQTEHLVVYRSDRVVVFEDKFKISPYHFDYILPLRYLAVCLCASAVCSTCLIRRDLT